MSKYKQFIFKSYSFDEAKKTAAFKYGYDDELDFTESYTFDFDYAKYDHAVLDRAIQNLFFIAGISYYKMYLAPVISVHSGNIDDLLADFLRQTYTKGLGEFFYVNKLRSDMTIQFPKVENSKLNMLSNDGEGALIGLGGGKDSLLSTDLLRDKFEVSTWSVGHKPQLIPLVERIELPHYWVGRSWDAQMLELNEKDALNGHVPISAILAATGCVTAVLAGKKDVVVSNENSASEPTLSYNGVEINHQYSKSLEFERMFQQVLEHQFGGTLRYYSLLRPLSELRIAELFALHSFSKYKDLFCSCNRAFRHESRSMSWCGECPKCAFVFLILTPFIERSDLESVYGKNLLLDSSLQETYKNLLGIAGEKPLECVGEIKESRYAMLLAFEQYPELRDVYQFDVPQEYNYQELHPHLIPAEIHSLISHSISPAAD